MNTKVRRIAGWVLIVAVGAFALVTLVQTMKPDVSYSAFRGWYADTPDGPAVVVELWSFRDAVPSYEPKYSQDAEQQVRYYSYRLSDDSLLGRFEREGWTIAGAWQNRLWACDTKATPLLLSSDGLSVVAERSAIQSATAVGLGGDFEVTGGRCYVAEYTGSLSVTGADGKRHWLTTDLRTEPTTTDSVYPPDWQCGFNGPDFPLIEARLALCLSPAAAPATSLLLSKPSALDKDAGRPELLSAVLADRVAPTKVLWSKSLSEFTKTPDAPFLIGKRQLDAHRAVLLLRTAGPIVHVVVIDPADGKVVESKVLSGLAALTQQLDK